MQTSKQRSSSSDTCYFVSDEHRYGRLEDALSDAVRRAYETQKHASVHVYAPTRQAAYNYGGEGAAHQFDLRGPGSPVIIVQVSANASLWG